MTAPAAHTSSRKGTRGRAAPAGGGEASTRAALTPDTWIAAATDVLVDQGIDHVRIDVLATQLGVTRGSFYWHFRDREELLHRVLQAWRESATIALTERLERAHADAREQLRDVLSLPLRGRAARRAARIELAIRAWARRNETARHAVDEADAARLAYISQVFSAMGFGITEARSRAALVYGFIVAQSLSPAMVAGVQVEARNRLVEQLVTQATNA